MSSTLRSRPCTLLLIWKYPTFPLPTDGSTDLRGGGKTLFTELYQVRAGVFIQKVQKTGKITNYRKKLEVMYDICDICNVNETGLFLDLQPSKAFTFR
jgi:hypothetical protein